jgi:hypothetical protein
VRAVSGGPLALRPAFGPERIGLGGRGLIRAILLVRRIRLVLLDLVLAHEAGLQELVAEVLHGKP